MNRLFTAAVAAATLFTVPAFAGSQAWENDPSHSAATFSVRHLGLSSVRGEFGKMTAKFNLDDKDITKSTAEATIDTSTINTREPKRDAHLKSEDFFFVEKYPSITFKSKKFEKAGEGKHKVTGDLTIRGVTKEVVLDVEGPTKEVKDPWGGTHIAATATTKINRLDYGLKWNKAIEAGGFLVGDDVNITLDLEFNKAQPAAAVTPAAATKPVEKKK